MKGLVMLNRIVAVAAAILAIAALPVTTYAQSASATGFYDANGRWQPVTAANPLPTTSSGGGGGSVSQGTVVTGDQAYTVGTNQPFNLTPSGRLKVGLSSAGNIDPALKASATLAADLTSCIYRATPPTWSDGWTGALACDSAGRLNVASNASQVGTWTVQPGNTANTTPWLFNGAYGAASTTSGQTGVMNLCAVTSISPGYTTATSNFLSCDTGGALRVSVGSVVPGVAATSLGKAEDAAHASGDTGVMVLGVLGSNNGLCNTPSSATSSDYLAFQMGVTGRLCVQTVPTQVPTTRANGTITTANTFQSVLASNTARFGCIVVNTSVNPMTVDVGASPAAATAIPLPAGATFNCALPSGVVITDQINLTSATATSTWVAWSQ